MNATKIAEKAMTHYENEYGNYATFSCDCGRDDNGAAYTYVGINEESEAKERRYLALANLIEHCEHEHIMPATLLVHPPVVVVNIARFDRE